MNKEDKAFLKELGNTTADMLEKKNDAYGDSYTKTYEKYGPVLLCAKIDDKMSRYKALIEAEQSDTDSSVMEADEKIEDSLKDAIGYLSLELLRRHKEISEQTEEEKKRATVLKRKRTIALRRKENQEKVPDSQPATEAIGNEAPVETIPTSENGG
jgi:hypothetical protein